MSRIVQAVTLFVFFCLALPRSASALDLVAAFDAALGELPESIASDPHGNLYYSMSNTVRRRAPGGATSVHGTLPIDAFVLGLEVGPDGCVYAASSSLTATPGAFVWRVCGPNQVEPYAALDPLGGPNDLTFDVYGNLYVTDPWLGRIWKIDSLRRLTVWLSHPLLAGQPEDPVLVIRAFGVNGITFDRAHQNVYVGNLDRGTILRIPLRRGGAASEPLIFASDARLRGADGIAFDDRDHLLVAVNAQDRLVSLDRDGDLTVLAEGGLLDGPSSIAFDRCGGRSFYVTSSAFSRAFGLSPGAPHPALLRFERERRRGGHHELAGGD